MPRITTLKTRFTMRKEFLHALPVFAAAAGLGFFSGCAAPSVSVVTPADLPENPSNIYTIVARVEPTNHKAVPESATAQIAIDGQVFPMSRSAAGKGLFEFDYTLPAGRNSVKFYVVGTYKVSVKGAESTRVEYTDLQEARILGRYVSTLDAYRGFVGAKIGILGKGFNPNDVVYLNGVAAKTSVESQGAISFYVPAVDPGANYAIEVSDGQTKIPAGSFHVDGASVSVVPGSLALRSGESAVVSFTLPVPAGAGGIYLDVTTNIPESVIMPEIFIPAGRTHTQVYVSGGKPGAGAIYLKGYGPGELVIPVTVQ